MTCTTWVRVLSAPACSAFCAAQSCTRWLPCFWASHMVWDIRDLSLTAVAAAHAGLLPCDCMLSGRRGPCNPSCFRAKIGTLLSVRRWKKFGDFVRRLRYAGQLLPDLPSREALTPTRNHAL